MIFILRLANTISIETISEINLVVVRYYLKAFAVRITIFATVLLMQRMKNWYTKKMVCDSGFES